MRNNSKDITDAFGMLVGTTILTLVFPYILPTMGRSIMEIKSKAEKRKFSIADHLGGTTGTAVGLIGNIVQADYYYNNPHMLLFPLSSNLILAGYELIRQYSKR